MVAGDDRLGSFESTERRRVLSCSSRLPDSLHLRSGL